MAQGYTGNTSTGGGGAITGLTGDVIAVGGGVAVAVIPPATVDYSQIQNVAIGALLGRGTSGGPGSMQEIQLGAGLQMNGTILTVTGGGGVGTSSNVLIDCGTFTTPSNYVLIDCGTF
jgi:hypothetical protein